MSWQDRIAIDPNVLVGKPIVKVIDDRANELLLVRELK